MQDEHSEAAVRIELSELRGQLAATNAARQLIQKDLDLRNAALDAATTNFLIIDVRQADKTIAYVNRAFATQHGYDHPQELIGHSIAIVAANANLSETPETVDSTLAQGQTLRMEAEVTRRDGTKFWAGVTTSALRNANGEVTHHVALSADITARRESERRARELQEQLLAEMRERERMGLELQLAQKLESVGRLAAGLAHEINTPIQYVGDSAHFLRSAFADLTSLFHSYRNLVFGAQGVESAEQRMARFQQLEATADLDFLLQEVPRAFERTLEGVQRVADLVRAMKEFAYPDQAEHTTADLNHALATTLIVARNEYKYAASVTTQFGELPQVVCNVGELNQVFLNLIVNAAHAVQDSGKDTATGCITIGTRVVGDSVEISVADNGCGIPEENRVKIFDPFYTTKEVGRGTGQGLAIARSIVVDRHAGDIEVSSTLDVGTTFTVRLPVRGKAGTSA